MTTSLEASALGSLLGLRERDWPEADLQTQLLLGASHWRPPYRQHVYSGVCHLPHPTPLLMSSLIFLWYENILPHPVISVHKETSLWPLFLFWASSSLVKTIYWSHGLLLP